MHGPHNNHLHRRNLQLDTDYVLQVSLMTMASTGGHLEVVKVLLQAAPPIDHEAHVRYCM